MTVLFHFKICINLFLNSKPLRKKKNPQICLKLILGKRKSNLKIMNWSENSNNKYYFSKNIVIQPKIRGKSIALQFYSNRTKVNIHIIRTRPMKWRRKREIESSELGESDSIDKFKNRHFESSWKRDKLWSYQIKLLSCWVLSYQIIYTWKERSFFFRNLKGHTYTHK